MDKAELQHKLKQFYCTNKYHRYGLELFLTDGVKFLADNAECYWLLDVINSYNMTEPKVQNEGFQVWKCVRIKDYEFMVTCTDGNKKVLTEQRIPFSDLILDEVTIWKEDDTLILPSEH